MIKILTVKTATINKKLTTFLKSVNNELSNFYTFKVNDPIVYFVNDRETLNAIFNRKTEDWFVGATKNNSIFLLNPKMYSHDSSHEASEFWQILKHEYSHVYFSQITKGNKPVWLNEGLASYLSGKQVVLDKKRNINLLNIFDYYSTSKSDVYYIGHVWTTYLIRKFGKNKLIHLIKALASCTDDIAFKEIFYSIYGFQFNRTEFKNMIKDF